MSSFSPEPPNTSVGEPQDGLIAQIRRSLPHQEYLLLVEEDGKWHLSPAYDMGYAYNPNGGWTTTHQMSVNEKFNNITRSDLLAFASNNNIKDAAPIIEEVCEAASHWGNTAKDCGVPSSKIEAIFPNMMLKL